MDEEIEGLRSLICSLWWRCGKEWRILDSAQSNLTDFYLYAKLSFKMRVLIICISNYILQWGKLTWQEAAEFFSGKGFFLFVQRNRELNFLVVESSRRKERDGRRVSKSSNIRNEQSLGGGESQVCFCKVVIGKNKEQTGRQKWPGKLPGPVYTTLGKCWTSPRIDGGLCQFYLI